jgi:hypothetical protein
MKDDGIQEAENRRISADPEGERQDGGRGKSRISAQNANSIAEVLEAALQRAPAPSGAGVFHYQCEVAEFPPCHGVRVLRREPVCARLFPFFVEVELQFVSQVSFPSASLEHPANLAKD